MINTNTSLRILIIEDNPGDFELVQNYIAEYGVHSIVQAKNFKEASALISLSESTFDIILLDLTLPDKSGMDLISEVLKIAGDCPVVILSGYSDLNFSIQSIHLGICDYLLKDNLTSENLYKSITYCIERKNKMQELQESEKRYNDLFQLSPQPMMLFDPVSLKFIQVNKAAIELYGYSEEEFLQITFADIKVETDVAFLKQYFENLTHFTDLYKGIFKHLKRSGEVIDVEVYSNLITIENKKFRSVIANDITQRRIAEQAIKQSEFKYRQIVETAQEGIWMIDDEDRTTFVNQKICDILGYSSDEMIGRTKFSFKDEESLQITAIHLQRRRQGISENYKTSFLTKTGDLIWTQVTSNPILNENKEYKGALYMVSDITEKLKADKMLLESEHKYRLLAHELEIEKKRLVKAQEVAKVGSWETDLQTLEVNWSRETHRIFGTDPDIFIPNHEAFLSFVSPQDKEKVDAAFSASLNNGDPNSIEHCIITVQGIEKCVEENWTITFDDNGVPFLATGTCQDITERKKAAEKIIRSEKMLKAAEVIAEIGSWEVDMVTHNDSWSDEYRRILGIKNDVIPSYEVFLSRVHPDDLKHVMSGIENAFSTQTDSSFNFRFIKPTGELGYAITEWEFEFDHYHKPLRINGILRDITEQKKAEIERERMTVDLIRRNKDLEQFSYIISHNLRAPVANIIGITAELKEDSHDSEVKKILTEELTKTVNSLDNVIIDLNTILQTNRDITENKEPVKISNLVNSIKSSIENLLQDQKVQILTDFTGAEELTTIRSYMQSIFYNLISNSIKYHQPGIAPIIEIKSEKRNGNFVITFMDNGRGIDLVRNKDLVFGLYKRFHTDIEGKGMGLFMVKTQVETLGGKIAINSEVNKGTMFTIEFET